MPPVTYHESVIDGQVVRGTTTGGEDAFLGPAGLGAQPDACGEQRRAQAPRTMAACHLKRVACELAPMPHQTVAESYYEPAPRDSWVLSGARNWIFATSSSETPTP